MTEKVSAGSVLEGKKIIFSGGSGYLGEVMAERLLKCGAKVANIGRRTPKFLTEYPTQASHYKVDFYESEDLTDVLGQAIEGLGGVDVLVNNSFDFSPKTGFNDPSGGVENISKETFMKGLESGIYWPLHCTQVVGKRMIEQKNGNIVNVIDFTEFLKTGDRSNFITIQPNDTFIIQQTVLSYIIEEVGTINTLMNFINLYLNFSNLLLNSN